jgi:hypothetical protein
MSKVKVTLRNFAKAPKKESIMWGTRSFVPLCVTLDRCGEDKTLYPTGVQSPNRLASSDPAAFTSIQTVRYAAAASLNNNISLFYSRFFTVSCRFSCIRTSFDVYKDPAEILSSLIQPSPPQK